MDEKKNICIDAARLAKQKAVDLYGDLDAVNGIGISRIDGSYAVRINLRQSPDEPLGGSRIRSEIDGVPVIIKVIGDVKKSFSNVAIAAETLAAKKKQKKKRQQ